MSDVESEIGAAIGCEPQTDEPSPAPAEMAGAGDDAGESVGVEPADSPANIGPPDHLIRHGSVEEAYAAYEERTRPHSDFGELMAARDARRRDHSARLTHWMNGGLSE